MDYLGVFHYTQPKIMKNFYLLIILVWLQAARQVLVVKQLMVVWSSLDPVYLTLLISITLIWSVQER